MRPSDINAVARTIYGEARGISWVGKIAVGWAIRNRVETDLKGDGKPDWWGEGYEAVCMMPWQFSCWLPNDPNRFACLNAGTGDSAFRECLAAAAAVIANIEPDPTGGATHYYNPIGASEPKWAKGKDPSAIVGPHLFFKDVER